MKAALVDPSWSCDNSIHFGCRQPHLPLQPGYCAALQEGDEVPMLEAAGRPRSFRRFFGFELARSRPYHGWHDGSFWQFDNLC